MRVLFGAPRKTGNAYLRCLLATAYDLQVAGLRDVPVLSDAASVNAWLAELPEQSVAGTNLACSPDLRVAAAAHGIFLFGVIRHPFDLFLSNFEVAQQKAARDKGIPEDAPLLQSLAGHALTDPAVLAYAQHGFATDVAWLRVWQAGAAATIQYERLLSSPSDILRMLSSVLGPTAPDAAARAIDLCQAENLVISRPARGRRMPAVPPNAWREHLPASLLSVLRERYADDVAALGYVSA